jgi:hypothetical protein
VNDSRYGNNQFIVVIDGAANASTNTETLLLRQARSNKMQRL